ncbi:MAG TPA: hypothetical protein H9687_03535 [Firmicutes bacterium]|nr:hypothetical protein [Bacillota bacterium]
MDQENKAVDGQKSAAALFLCVIQGKRSIRGKKVLHNLFSEAFLPLKGEGDWCIMIVNGRTWY